MIKNIKKIIILIIILIIIILLSLFVLKNTNNESIEDLNEEQDISNLLDNNFVEVDSYEIYYSTKNIINDFIIYYKQINGDEDLMLADTEKNDQEEISTRQKSGIQSIYNMLDNKYISECNIIDKNIIDMAEKIKKNGQYNQDIVYDLDISSMYTAEVSPDIVYVLAYSTINDIEFNIIVKFDYVNNTYSVFGKEYIEKFGYSENTTISELNIDENYIEDNGYNTFYSMNITNAYIARQYFEDFKDKILANPKKAYEKIDEEYKNEKYGDYENYKKYVEENYNKIKNAEFSQYQVGKNGEYSQYICVDENENYYIFLEKSLFDYAVILDTYTIALPEFSEKYNNATDQEKVLLNIQKIFNAMNLKDYEYVYKKLETSFKNNNFQTEEKFEEYIKNNFYEYNSFKYSNYQKNSNIHTIDLQITDSIEGENRDIIEKSLIVKLIDEKDFIFSFNVN